MNAPRIDVAAVAGLAVFYDGLTANRHAVAVELATKTLRMHATNGVVLAEWPYDELETLPSPDNVLRLGRARNSVLARLEVKDTHLASAIDERSVPVDRAKRIERRLRAKVILWSLAATASLLAVGVVGVPLIATELTPLVPYALERKLAVALDARVHQSLDTPRTGAGFECGRIGDERAGRAAFDSLMRQLETAAGLPLPLNVRIVRKAQANAITLPGGYIYVFAGLIKEANTADELAGVIAHELGHVAHRDGTRTVLQGAGLSLLFGMLLGDFVGGGAVIFAAKTVLQTSYSREAEAAADSYGVQLMERIGGDPRALAAILGRIANGTHPGPKILADHPETRERVSAIERLAVAGPRRPLLNDAEWAALKAVCSG
jgi:Zn-dependent protease with chaperone function